MSAHPHAALMLLYAQDAAETDEPWVRWEYQVPDDGSWCLCVEGPRWIPDVKYRRQAKMMSVNGHEFPDPLRAAPEVGETYWTIYLIDGDPVSPHVWGGGEYDTRALQRGIAHSTKDAALAHVRALLSVTEVSA